MLQVLGDAGRDKQRHKLAQVKCCHCGLIKIMRTSDLTKVKSCGCLKAARYKEMIRQRNKKPIKLLGESVFSEYDNSTMTPLQICQAVMAKGLFVSSVKPKRLRSTLTTSDKSTDSARDV